MEKYSFESVKKILIIEDNEEIRENTAELLGLHNYDVFTAEEGGEGYEMAKKHEPDLILCDIMMPETDGRRFLRLAKNDKSVRDIPLIFFSAGTGSPEVQKALTGTKAEGCDARKADKRIGSRSPNIHIYPSTGLSGTSAIHSLLHYYRGRRILCL